MAFVLGLIIGIGLTLIILRNISPATDAYRDDLLEETLAYKEMGKGFHRY